ncbi:YjbH domain-containing protein [Phaeobacter inhibens]|uniref:YjbH domain-containing protein n=1 Tax=Phaeobacter inhibens TaxID=221822 RepID=UPI000C9C6BB5|nr:YjbH domain-containing protein [Phaeobacter inhibens]AUQ64836.1 Bacterial putative lipoprotein [Phaeobacter inhibens]AUQ84675.1 Bacterial putative lipoprotein [Phaeobacter inhibens]AUQ92755.1 Bacterial putative lipoprotein [Phaeobacter inhibens]MDO6758401.1 YjbH domain-containing protein [Phaeobacter inhibens]
MARMPAARILATSVVMASVAPPAQAQDALTTPKPEAARFKPLPAPSLNFYGSPGLVDMPSAEMLPDGQFATTYSWFGGQARYNLTFQATPWLSASFRYNGIQTNGAQIAGFSTYYDRGFDVRLRLLREGRYRPAVTLGLQDFAGTGIYAGEYIVATKNFDTPALSHRGGAGRLKLTAGLGWGRLGSNGSIGSISGTRPGFVAGDTGGELAYDQWFRGEMAPFAGIEWLPNDRWGFKAEYSSDAYVLETGAPDVFERKSSFNFGAEYQARPGLRLGAYYLYGSEIGVTAQIQLNPKHPTQPMRVSAPMPVAPRSSWATEDSHWSRDWAQSTRAKTTLRDLMSEALQQDGLILEALTLPADGTEAELRYRNPRYRAQTLAIGRAARAMARLLPPSVETLKIVPMRGGLALSQVVIRRSDLEALEHSPDATEALWAVTGLQEAGPLAGDALVAQDLYPAFSTSISPYTAPSYFDPDLPFRLDVGVDLKASYAPAPGWRIAGTIRQRVWGNVKDGRASNSVLPHVRTDATEYAQFGTTLKNLYVTRQWQMGRDLYARSTAGLFESMFGGVSGEVLWKPVSSRLALGVEGNYVVQRDYDQRLSFRDYKTFTGHASAYYQLDKGYHVQVDAGRYLAGDYGATFSLDREFANGWRVGGFFTLTDVSSEDFGEGSFDKGFRFSIPLDWLLGKPSRNTFGMTVRPTQRDGGQRVHVPDRLYGQIREAHRAQLTRQRARIWE